MINGQNDSPSSIDEFSGKNGGLGGDENKRRINSSNAKEQSKSQESSRERKMVLWEITLGTAYFLGLKRTYRLALKLQRRIISPKLPKIRQFLHRRTRAVFDVALKVHLNIQQRDLEVGRNLGNWILRLLDRYKPSAQIRKQDGEPMTNAKKQISSSSILKMPESSQTLKKPKSSRQLFTSSTNIWPKQFPTISMMIKSSNPASNMIQHRHFGILTTGALGPKYIRGWQGGVIREDIRQWMLQN